MAKKVTAILKLQVAAGKANPSPPIGPALGQAGVNIMAFCKEFNAKTQSMEPGVPLPTVITVYADKSFDFVTKQPPNTYHLKKAAKIQKGSGRPHEEKVAQLSVEDLKVLAEAKMPDLTAADLDAAVRTLAGSARSMGIDVVGLNKKGE